MLKFRANFTVTKQFEVELPEGTDRLEILTALEEKAKASLGNTAKQNGEMESDCHHPSEKVTGFDRKHCSDCGKSWWD